jgi:uncharacterized membrane protein HdeD (DUF308 family)
VTTGTGPRAEYRQQQGRWSLGEKGAAMASDGFDAEPFEPSPSAAVAGTWQAGIVLGVLTLVLGVVVTFHPTGSLNVIAVLLGILMLLSGLFHLIRVLDPRERHRIWLGITGLLFIVVGVILIRHLHLTRALIGLVIGLTWVVQGLTAFIGGIVGGVREGRAFWIFFGAVSLIAGIVVVSAPASSLNVLAVLFGVWFVVMGIMEVVGAFLLRHSLREMRSMEMTSA